MEKFFPSGLKTIETILRRNGEKISHKIPIALSTIPELNLGMSELFFEKLMELLKELSGPSAKTWQSYQDLLLTLEDNVAKKPAKKVKPKGK